MKTLILIACLLVGASAQAQFISTASAASVAPFAIDKAITTAMDKIASVSDPVAFLVDESEEVTTVSGVNDFGEVVSTVTIITGPCPPTCDEQILYGPCPPNCD